MRGLDPRIHLLGVSYCERMMDPRVTPVKRCSRAFDCSPKATPQRLRGHGGTDDDIVGWSHGALIGALIDACVLRGRSMVQIVSEVRRLLVVTRDFVLAALDDGFWEGCGR